MTGDNTPELPGYNDLPSVDEDVAKLRLKLRHCSLEELEEAGLVKRDTAESVVKKGPEFDDENTRISCY